MSTISAGTSSGTALVSTGDTSGNLELQSSGVTKLTVGSSGVTLASALPATSGGTGATTYTTGDVLYASATNTLSKLGIGSSNQVLTVSGGVPAWATPATPASGLTLLQTVTASSSTTADITGFSSTYKNYRIIFADVKSTSGGAAELGFRIDVGSGYDGAPSTYIASNGVSALAGTSTNPIKITGYAMQASNSALGGVMDITGRTMGFLNIVWLSSLVYNVSSTFPSFGVTGKESTTTLTGLRFLTVSGSVFSGTFKLYGYQD